MSWIRSRLAAIGPNRDAHNERIKLIVLTMNAAGLAAVVTGVFGPLFDAARRLDAISAASGAVFWAVCAVAAFEILGYIRGKD